MMRMIRWLALVAFVLVPAFGCSDEVPVTHQTYLAHDFPVADGFDFPVGDKNGKGSYIDQATGKKFSGWYIASKFCEVNKFGIHPGEDWNGNGGGNTDKGQPVYSVAHGKVVFADASDALWGNTIVIEHLFYENHRKLKIRSLYTHLGEIKVKAGQTVKRRQQIGTIGQDVAGLYKAHLHFELRWDESLEPTFWPTLAGKDIAWVKEHYAHPTMFIQSHRTLFDPTSEKTLILVSQKEYRMWVYQNQKLVGDCNVSFGQAKGRKRVQGDNKTPKGMYFVVARHRGEFSGDYGRYYGGHWIKINYPNGYDAAWGQAQGKITRKQSKAIESAWQDRELTLQKTALGGGIGFHGWIDNWPDSGPRHLSWGCIVMHNRDIKKLFDKIPAKTMVVIR